MSCRCRVYTVRSGDYPGFRSIKQYPQLFGAETSLERSHYSIPNKQSTIPSKLRFPCFKIKFSKPFLVMKMIEVSSLGENKSPPFCPLVERYLR